jgi:hypothetical protein
MVRVGLLRLEGLPSLCNVERGCLRGRMRVSAMREHGVWCKHACGGGCGLDSSLGVQSSDFPVLRYPCFLTKGICGRFLLHGCGVNPVWSPGFTVTAEFNPRWGGASWSGAILACKRVSLYETSGYLRCASLPLHRSCGLVIGQLATCVSSTSK